MSSHICACERSLAEGIEDMCAACYFKEYALVFGMNAEGYNFPTRREKVSY